MSRLSSLATIVALLASTLAAAAEPVEIPLKDVWATNMPGTRNINALDSGEAREQLVEPLMRKIRDEWKFDLGCAVPGQGLDALRTLYRLRMSDGNLPAISSDDAVSLAFYTTSSGAYVRVHKVERNGNTFTIRYRFEPHQTREATKHLALIPVGKLPAGKYIVKVEQTPIEKRFTELGYQDISPEFGAEVVCGSFRFSVVQRR